MKYEPLLDHPVELIVQLVKAVAGWHKS